MSLTLYFHPLSSFCQKVLVGMYELDVPFTKQLVDLGNQEERAALLKLWPIGKFPVLRDEAKGITVPETTIILEYVEERARARGRLLPTDSDTLRECRLRDRFYDLYVNVPMGKIVTDKLRPESARDPYGVEQAKAQLETAYAIADDWMRRNGPWALGEQFTLADCAAAPGLLYAKQVLPFGDRHRHLSAYFERLEARPSFARVVEEAKPYWALFPG
ncbi:MAG TPA: glutathione S-transferase family protein [Polyangiaceae bacterium]|nr:glutathione S-transferase family protein [Polyangiaceae bacterium]